MQECRRPPSDAQSQSLAHEGREPNPGDYASKPGGRKTYQSTGKNWTHHDAKWDVDSRYNLSRPVGQLEEEATAKKARNTH